MVEQGKEPDEFLQCFGVHDALRAEAQDDRTNNEACISLYRLAYGEDAGCSQQGTPPAMTCHPVLRVGGPSLFGSSAAAAAEEKGGDPAVAVAVDATATAAAPAVTEDGRAMTSDGQCWPGMSVLESDGVFVVDCTTQIFVWCGKKCNGTAKAAGVKVAQSALDCRVLPDFQGENLNVLIVHEGMEPFLFQLNFRGWAQNQNHLAAICTTPKGFELSTRTIATTQYIINPDQEVQEMATQLLEGFNKYKPTSDDEYIESIGVSIDCLEEIKMYELDSKEGNFVFVGDFNDYGHFNIHKSYAVHCRFHDKRNGSPGPGLLFVWHGRKSPTSHKLLWNIDRNIRDWKNDKFGKIQRSFEVLQGKEPLLFRKLFSTCTISSICYHHNIANYACNQSREEADHVLLYKIQSLPGGQFQTTQINTEEKFIFCSQAVFFCISKPQRNFNNSSNKDPEAWFWMGARAPGGARRAAAAAAASLLRRHGLPADLPRMNIIQEEDLHDTGSASSVAWLQLKVILGCNATHHSCVVENDTRAENERNSYLPPQLYRPMLCFSSGAVRLAKESSFTQDSLPDAQVAKETALVETWRDDVALLAVIDAWEAVYVWHHQKNKGETEEKQSSTPGVLEQVEKAAKLYLTNCKAKGLFPAHPDRQVVLIDGAKESSIPALFKTHFGSWEPMENKEFCDPYEQRYKERMAAGTLGDAQVGKVIENGKAHTVSEKVKSPSDCLSKLRGYSCTVTSPPAEEIVKTTLTVVPENDLAANTNDRRNDACTFLEESSRTANHQLAQEGNKLLFCPHSKTAILSNNDNGEQDIRAEEGNRNSLSPFPTLPYSMEMGLANEDTISFLRHFGQLEDETKALLWGKGSSYISRICLEL